ncbi:MerR family transcriptional regulator [Companilactobacillus alimentarius]|uniref:HTH merR-type domain-containing protein n=1 Tax=Companilactobacillus alimentarius DSM 20249 TaxID=1423720 RepID=A0A2K9HQN6_9LACO|nr:MerR family transcriptional regulator [Companilactobacillus alimentarius]AUI71942.1 hypothetical protein LA20249_07030 [Companilactobacillus alimentarius DSM 20249]KRK77888.1 transcriptional regulator [Companilactobacillus alimentarius DSM 20249]MDT6952469.1 MerR family transcriptional regulator [Companilactobacillus alimentarius]GEO45307.1 MerR family transcriptional regulator [Companilactobacillus alimentarius]
MLKISEMAKLADTTRRTLIFYDEQGVFHPKERNEKGYRYYDYDQLYDLLFILGMKNLGLPLEKIKELQSKPNGKIIDELINVQENIDKKIDELSKIQTVVNKKISAGSELMAKLYEPMVARRPRTIFWCSRKEASCTDEDIARLFGEFYKQLDKLALMDGNQSGFLTDLPEIASEKYPDAAFRVVKASSTNISRKVMPKIEKPSGDYAVVKVENSTKGVLYGLDKLKKFCDDKHLLVTTDMWQLNDSSTLTNRGASDNMWLEYLIEK